MGESLTIILGTCIKNVKSLTSEFLLNCKKKAFP